MNRELRRFPLRETDRGADAAMARYAEGDEAAFSTVYAALSPAVRAFLARRVHRKAVIDDLVQETFLRLHRHRARYRPGLPVRPWAMSIAARLFLDHLRREASSARLFSASEPPVERATCEPDPEQLLAARRLLVRVEGELARMPRDRRRAFRYVRLEGHSMDDLADAEATTFGAVKARVFRAASDLRTALRDGE